MMASGLSDAWGVYLEAMRVHAHQLLAWAHADVRPSLHDALDEPSITGLLGDAMKARLHAPETPQAYDLYTIGDQEPISPSGQMGNDRLRLDLCVIRSGVKPRLRYIYEAKRLRTGHFPIGRYVGPSGIGDFLEGRYGAENPEAVMVGLFQNKDAGYWEKELRRSFDEDDASVLERLAPVQILDSLPNELHSIHRRRDTGPIRLFHIFLDCTGPGSRASTSSNRRTKAVKRPETSNRPQQRRAGKGEDPAGTVIRKPVRLVGRKEALIMKSRRARPEKHEGLRAQARRLDVSR